MNFVKFLVILIVAGVVFGAAGFFAYQIYVKPAQLDRRAERAVADAPAATPLPDYSVAAFERAAAEAEQAATPLAARDIFLNFVSQYPQSPKAAEAKARVGEINTDLVFTSGEGPGKVDYTVVSGDSLVRIASRTNSNAELIMRSNNLLSIDLQIGQQLRVPQLTPTLVIDRAAKTLTIFNDGQFFKEYPLLAFEVPSMRSGGPFETEVGEKLAQRGSDRVPFGSREYVGSDRWLMLKQSGVVVRGFPELTEDGQPNTLPPGIVVSQEDIEEIFPLVARGTPVTIQ